MPELRKDPIVGRWVIIAMERARRPGNFIDPYKNAWEAEKKNCPHCRLKEKPLLTMAKKGKASFKDWDVCVVPSRNPFLETDNNFHREKEGLYETIDGFGTHEVIIETRDHIANMADLDVEQISLVFKTYALRMKELEKNKEIQFVLAYKNYGWTAGGHTQGHCRSHLIATPVNPLRVVEKLKGAKEYFDREKKCIYCDLIKQELDEKTRIVAENEHFVALTPFAARFLFETWILPKEHCCDYAQGIKDHEKDLASIVKILLMKFKNGLNDPPYNFILQTSPFRQPHSDPHRWETLKQDFHWHIELMPRLTQVAGFEKGTGFYICSVPPEYMAEYLRGIPQ